MYVFRPSENSSGNVRFAHCYFVERMRLEDTIVTLVFRFCFRVHVPAVFPGVPLIKRSMYNQRVARLHVFAGVRSARFFCRGAGAGGVTGCVGPPRAIPRSTSRFRRC